MNMASCSIKLYILDNGDAIPKYVGRMKTLENDCFRDLRQQLEAAGIIEWPFDS